VTTAAAPIAVTARIVWGKDGEEHVPASAIAWTSTLVLIELRDPRCATIAAWFDPADLRR